jgi:hypothetical protein
MDYRRYCVVIIIYYLCAIQRRNAEHRHSGNHHQSVKRRRDPSRTDVPWSTSGNEYQVLGARSRQFETFVSRQYTFYAFRFPRPFFGQHGYQRASLSCLAAVSSNRRRERQQWFHSVQNNRYPTYERGQFDSSNIVLLALVFTLLIYYDRLG